MFKRIHNWYLSALVAIVSIFSLVLIQQYVTAQGWADPDTLPGGTPANNLVVTPMLQELQLGGSDVADANLRIDGNGANVIQISNGGKICFSGTTDCASAWPIVGAGNLWTANGNKIYYNNGNVGIGIDNPQWPLDVLTNVDNYGTINLVNSNPGPNAFAELQPGNDAAHRGGFGIGSTNNAAAEVYRDRIFVGSGSSQGISIVTEDSSPGFPDDIRFFTNGRTASNEKMRITAGGNIGIGTTNPTRKLSIYDGSTGPMLSLSGLTTNYRGMSLRRSSDDVENWFVGANSSNHFVIRKNEQNPNYFMIDYTSGNVGIGEAPHNGYKLSIGGGTGIPLEPALKLNPGEIYASQSRLKLKSTSYVYVDQNFGIGTDSPQVALDVNNATLPSGTNPFIRVVSWANGLYGSTADTDNMNGGPMDFRFGATENYGVTTRGFTIREETAGANRFFIAATTGNVGIGLTNPSYKLDVSGSIHGTSYYSSDGTAGISTTMNTGACTITVKNGLITGTTCP